MAPPFAPLAGNKKPVRAVLGPAVETSPRLAVLRRSVVFIVLVIFALVFVRALVVVSRGRFVRVPTVVIASRWLGPRCRFRTHLRSARCRRRALAWSGFATRIRWPRRLLRPRARSLVRTRLRRSCRSSTTICRRRIWATTRPRRFLATRIARAVVAGIARTVHVRTGVRWTTIIASIARTVHVWACIRRATIVATVHAVVSRAWPWCFIRSACFAVVCARTVFRCSRSARPIFGARSVVVRSARSGNVVAILSSRTIVVGCTRTATIAVLRRSGPILRRTWTVVVLRSPPRCWIVVSRTRAIVLRSPARCWIVVSCTRAIVFRPICTRSRRIWSTASAFLQGLSLATSSRLHRADRRWCSSGALSRTLTANLTRLTGRYHLTSERLLWSSRL